MISWARLAGGWNRFFHEPSSPLPTVLYRIALGLTLFVDAAIMAPDALLYWGPDGMVSAATARKLAAASPGLDLLLWLPDRNGVVVAFFALYVAAVISLTLGFFTRTSAALVYLGLTSLHHRNSTITNGCDNFLRLAPAFLIFSPAGERWSIDAWRRARKGIAPRPVASPWAQRMIQLQLCVLYVDTVLLKLRGTAWVNGTALYYTSRLLEYRRFPLPYIPEHMWTIHLATWGTLVVEFALGTLIWVEELRIPVLIAGVCLHLGIEYSMNVPIMQWVNIGAYAVFLKPAEIQRAAAWIRSTRPAQTGWRAIASLRARLPSAKPSEPL